MSKIDLIHYLIHNLDRDCVSDSEIDEFFTNLDGIAASTGMSPSPAEVRSHLIQHGLADFADFARDAWCDAVSHVRELRAIERLSR